MTRASTLPLGDAIPTRGNGLSRAFGRLLFRVSGWGLEGHVPNLPKLVIVVAPHTSNWDFFLGVATLFSVGFKVSWLGKHSIFRWPVRGILRWLGGIPVDRRKSAGLVEQAVGAFNQHEQFLLAVAPEGTRRKVDTWRTGFYRIAEGASVPITLAYFDYGRKRVGFGPTMQPCGDLEADLETMQAFYRTIVPKHPSQFAD